MKRPVGSRRKPNETHLLIYDQTGARKASVFRLICPRILAARPPLFPGPVLAHAPGISDGEGRSGGGRGSAQPAPRQLRFDNNSAGAFNEYTMKTPLNDSSLFFRGLLGVQSTPRGKSSRGSNDPPLSEGFHGSPPCTSPLPPCPLPPPPSPHLFFPSRMYR